MLASPLEHVGFRLHLDDYGVGYLTSCTYDKTAYRLAPLDQYSTHLTHNITKHTHKYGNMEFSRYHINPQHHPQHPQPANSITTLDDISSPFVRRSSFHPVLLCLLGLRPRVQCVVCDSCSYSYS